MSRHEGVILGAIVASAFALRVFVAVVAPDEDDFPRFAAVAKRTSLNPSRLMVPLGEGSTYHPLLSAYLIKAGSVAFGRTRIGTRLPFVLLSTASVVFLYLCVRSGMGVGPAQMAASLAAIDHFGINVAILRLPRVYVTFIPAVLYLFWRGISARPHRASLRSFVLLGLAAGLAYLAKESIAMLGPPLALFLVLNRRFRHWLRRPQPYVAILIALAVAGPSLWWNLSSGMPNYQRNMARVSGWGISPRPLVLYAGELLPLVTDLDRQLILTADQIFHPRHGPMGHLLGIFCLVAVCRAAVGVRSDFDNLLLCVFGCVVVFSSVVAPQQPLNNFWWASATVYPALAFAGKMCWDWLRGGRWRRAMVCTLLAALVVSLWSFATARTFFDRMPFRRRAVCALAFHRAEYYPERHPEVAAIGARLLLSDLQDPYAMALMGAAKMHEGDLGRAAQCMDRALRRKPDSAVVNYLRGRLATRMGNGPLALDHLRRAQSAIPKSSLIARRLGDAYLQLGQPDNAATQFGLALSIKPEDTDLLVCLASALIQAGRVDAARTWLDAALSREPGHPRAHALAGEISADPG